MPVQYLYGWPETLNIYTRCVYSTFGRGFTKHTVMYGVYTRFWPTLNVWPSQPLHFPVSTLHTAHLHYFTQEPWTDITPLLTDVTPALNDITLLLIVITPLLTDITPILTDITPLLTDVTPLLT